MLPGLDIKFFLTAKVVIHGGNVGLGLPADFRVGGPPESLFGEDLGRCGQQTALCFLGVFPLFAHLFVLSEIHSIYQFNYLIKFVN
jgi:hypothetical protein